MSVYLHDQSLTRANSWRPPKQLQRRFVSGGLLRFPLTAALCEEFENNEHFVSGRGNPALSDAASLFLLSCLLEGNWNTRLKGACYA